jgi:hypothetical protein
VNNTNEVQGFAFADVATAMCDFACVVVAV